jgi:hypothetical protein
LPIAFRILTDQKGLAQLNLNDTIYFCGSKYNDFYSGAYFFKYEPNVTGSNLNFLINSKNYHYFPTLIFAKNEFIIVIGGLESTSCEIYSIFSHIWKTLPDLPDERYKCSAYSDNSTDHVYLFGGYNSYKKVNYGSILKLNLKQNVLWESFYVNSDTNLLSKNSTAIMKINNTVYILGGEDNNNCKTDEIIEFNLNSRRALLSKNSLCKPSSFLQVSGVDLGKNVFYIFDDEFFIHKFSKNELSPSIIKYNNMNN